MVSICAKVYSCIPLLVVCSFFVFSAACGPGSPQNGANVFSDLRHVDVRWDQSFLDLGEPAAALYMLPEWKGTKVYPDGTSAAILGNGKAGVSVQLYRAEPRTLSFRCRTQPGASSRQILTAYVNGYRLRSYAIDPTWREFSFPIDADLLKAGRNAIEISNFVPLTHKNESAGIELDFIRLLKTEIAEDAALDPKLITASVAGREDSSRLMVPVPSIVSIYAHLSEDASLFVRFGFAKETAAENAAAHFRITVHADEGDPVTVLSETLRPGYFSQPRNAKTIGLKRFRNQVVRISFEVEQPENAVSPSTAFWEEALLSGAKSALEQPVANGPKLELQQKPNVIIYLVDAMRPDHLEPYGYQKPTSPGLRQFAGESVLFLNAYTHTAWTRPSVASLLTGLHPSSHLTEDRMDTIPDFLPSIPLKLKAAGYATSGFVSQPNVDPQFGFAKHFDEYRTFYPQGPQAYKGIHIQSDRLYNALHEFLSGEFSQPMFLYVHAVDTHGPYTPDPNFIDPQPNCDPNKPEMFFPEKYHRREYTKEEIECVISIYNGTIRQTDYFFGLFLDELKKRNAYDNSLIIFTADHGESFLEHGRWGHGRELHQTELRVPLIMRLPHGKYAGSRPEQPARLIDVFPTVLDALSLEAPGALQGSSLLPLLSKENQRNAPVFSELNLDGFRVKSVILDDFKLIEKPAGTMELYDLSRDPNERTNLVAQNPVRAGYLSKILSEWSAGQEKLKAHYRKPPAAKIDKETEEQLRALGYIQ